MNGITWASLQMKLSPILKESYNDNLFLLEDEGDKEDDFIHATGLFWRLDQSGQDLVSLLNYYIESETYSKNVEFDNVRHDAYLQLKIMPSGVISFDVKNLFRSIEEFDLTYERIELRPFGAIERQKRNINHFNARMNCQIGGRSVLFFDYKHDLDDVETIRELDERINSAQIGFDYNYGRMNKNRFSLIFEVRDYAFKGNRIEGKDKGFATYSLTAVSLLDISYQSKLGSYGGILVTQDKNRDSLMDEDHFFLGGISYSAEFNDAQINFSYDYEISSSGGFGELVERESIQLKGIGFLNSYFTAGLSSNLRENDYSESNVSSSKNDNKTLIFRADLSYDNEKKFMATLSYSFFRNNYLMPEEAGITDYKQESMALNINYVFLEQWILKIEYNYTWRETIDKIVTLNDISFERSLITIGIQWNPIRF
jgi:hypothetical protein